MPDNEHEKVPQEVMDAAEAIVEQMKMPGVLETVNNLIQRPEIRVIASDNFRFVVSISLLETLRGNNPVVQVFQHGVQLGMAIATVEHNRNAVADLESQWGLPAVKKPPVKKE